MIAGVTGNVLLFSSGGIAAVLGLIGCYFFLSTIYTGKRENPESEILASKEFGVSTDTN
jgi:hypothetical protein